ncbi:MAG: sugar phosphate isomerase/epimerase [Bacteroidales bacterium]|nr:sugar phosphate isomerase/epimerase [Bacteroidales bacterium]
MITRRKFIKSTAIAGLATTLIPKSLFAADLHYPIGIQLYTIRDMVSNDLPGTLKILAEIGYNTIEAAGYGDGKFYGYEPNEFKKLVEDTGLIPLSTHSGVTIENAAKVAEDSIRAGMRYLVLPSLGSDYRKDMDGYKRAAEDFNKIGEVCKLAGISFGYHNHGFEFVKMNGEVPYNVLLENTDPELVFMQVDTYWMVYGGYDPLDYFNSYPGQFKLWHVKDMVEDESQESTEIGSGKLDFPAYFDMAKTAGLEAVFVEQESFKIDPVKSITKSYQYLKSL